MNIQHFSQQGKRSNNEDSLGVSAGLLTVCDGMGGHNYGERASAFVKEAMIKSFAESRALGKMEIQQQLSKVQTELNQVLETEPELEKMGTTFTGVFITPDVWYAAHIGDSRIYLFRPSEQKLWHTWDHSLVGELMRNKEITLEAGRFHPMSNRISKAIIATKDGKPVSPSIVKIDELKKGDIFLLCSDGVVEGWGDWELVQLFSDTSLTFEQKCKKLAQQCNEISKDNNTAIIAEVEENDAFSYGTNDELEWTTFAAIEADYNQYVKDNSEPEVEAVPQIETPDNDIKHETVSQKTDKNETGASACNEYPKNKPVKENNRKKMLPILLFVILLVSAALIFVLFGKKGKSEDDDACFKKCATIEQYNDYIKQFGESGKHYEDAKKAIDSLNAVGNSSVEEEKEKVEQPNQSNGSNEQEGKNESGKKNNQTARPSKNNSQNPAQTGNTTTNGTQQPAETDNAAKNNTLQQKEQTKQPNKTESESATQTNKDNVAEKISESSVAGKMEDAAKRAEVTTTKDDGNNKKPQQTNDKKETGQESTKK